VSQIILFALLGLGPGALIAGLSIGMVLNYRGSGVINLGAGAIAVVGAYVFYGLKTGGYLFVVPVFGWPDQISLGGPWSTLPALVMAIVLSALLGLVIEVVAFRALRTVAPLGKLLASIGVLIIIQAVIVLRFGSSGQVAPAVFPNGPTNTFHVAGQTVPTDRLWLTAVVVGIAALMWALYRFTGFGLSSRAASENETLAMVMGMSPNRISLLNSVLASAVYGALGALAASQTQLDPTTIPLAVVPALAAVLLARFTSFSVAAAAGLGMGVIQSLITYLQSLSWFPTAANQPLPGVYDLTVFLILVAVMLFRGNTLPQRGAAIERRLPIAPPARWVARPAVVTAVVLAVSFLVLPFDFRQALTNTLIGIVVSMSIVLLTGFVGQISLAQVALSGVAGFVVSRMATGAGLAFPIGPLAGIAVAAVVGIAIGAPALRVRGINLAVLTIAGARALESFWFTNPKWGGGTSTLPVPQPSIFGIHFGPTAAFPVNNSGPPSPVFGLVCSAVVIVLGMALVSLRRSELGQRMLAVRSNERASAAVGINVRGVKLTAFALSSAIAGVAGVLYAYNYSSVSSENFDVVLALTFIAFVYISGITSVLGAVIAGLGITSGLLSHVIDRYTGIPSEWQLLAAGLALVLMIGRKPDGLAGGVRNLGGVIEGRWRARFATGPAAPSVSSRHEATEPVEAGR
jgi:branched-chain amino acid transport system permease protein